ncbi:MAG: HNH endonuclease [Opitutales bacterium]|nr:HNH endonuclease [Opitutales bacterium]
MNWREKYLAVRELCPFATSLPTGEEFVVQEKARSIGIYFLSDSRSPGVIGEKLFRKFFDFWSKNPGKIYHHKGEKNSESKIYRYFLRLLGYLIERRVDSLGSLESSEIDIRYSKSKTREGWKNFRAGVLAAYSFRCAVTGVDVVSVLQAAHIRPYYGAVSNRVSNGLCLRSDIHLLFDAHLLRIDECYRIHVNNTLRKSIYYRFNGSFIETPKDPKKIPEASALQSRFTSQQGPSDAF